MSRRSPMVLAFVFSWAALAACSETGRIDVELAAQPLAVAAPTS